MKVYVIQKSVYQENGEVVKYIAKVMNTRENAEAYIEYMKYVEKDKKEFIYYYIDEENVSENENFYKLALEAMKLFDGEN